MRNPFPKKKSPLSSLQKTLAAVRALHRCMYSDMSPEESGKILRSDVKLQWTFLTAIQFLTGKEAIASIMTLPHDVVFDGLGKPMLLEMLARAHDIAANSHPSGATLSSGLLVKKFKRAT
jgi:hypothetical protein